MPKDKRPMGVRVYLMPADATKTSDALKCGWYSDGGLMIQLRAGLFVGEPGLLIVRREPKPE